MAGLLDLSGRHVYLQCPGRIERILFDVAGIPTTVSHGEGASAMLPHFSRFADWILSRPVLPRDRLRDDRHRAPRASSRAVK